LFVWLRLPSPLSALALRPLAAQAGVAFAPGSWFFPEAEEGRSHLRLNFAVQTPDRIAEGIRRLGSVVSVMRAT
jgi:DNA-binding transcriptional MocR family regulator